MSCADTYLILDLSVSSSFSRSIFLSQFCFSCTLMLLLWGLFLSVSRYLSLDLSKRGSRCSSLCLSVHLFPNFSSFPHIVLLLSASSLFISLSFSLFLQICISSCSSICLCEWQSEFRGWFDCLGGEGPRDRGVRNRSWSAHARW